MLKKLRQLMICNLFTQARPSDELPRRYIETLERQAARVQLALGDNDRFARVAFGGGTPTQLELPLLERLFGVADRMVRGSFGEIPASLETSPETATTDRLGLAADRRVDRLSIGIQSFVDAELKALGRPVTGLAAMRALDRIRATHFSTLNVDLMYGVAGQTMRSWLSSVRTALQWRPEEFYLYPLYVRPMTGFGRQDRAWQDSRRNLYRAARDLLIDEGYAQVSMRMFRRKDAASSEGPVYCCQEDSMVGLGCGARSYTTGLHYSDEWAVSRTGVRGIIAEWLERTDESFDRAWYGYELDPFDQRTRCVLQSILQAEGLELSAYKRRFDGELLEDRPELLELVEADLASADADRFLLTPSGLELSDAIGGWLYSDKVRERMRDYSLL